MSNPLRKLIGNRRFYAMVIAVVLPIIVQNAITNFVNLLDNLMVGRIGTEQMSGVAIANQLIFVFNLAIFGAVSGAGIFAAQYHGAGNVEGVRASMRYKLILTVALCLGAIALFIATGPKLVSLYLTDTSDPERVQRTLDFALEYLHVMLIGLIPFTITQCYAGTLRETGETAMPMYAGIIAVAVNMTFNYLLIFGKFGFPQLGVAGAAYATILSRYVEMVVILIYTHRNTAKHPFAAHLYRTLHIPGSIVSEITRKGTPLLFNELLWSMGTATLAQIYSLRGLDVVAATNISTTVYNLFSVAFLSMGTATSIIVGQALGANEIKTAKDHAVKLIAFAAILSAFFSAVLLLLSRWIPLLYNTSDAVHHLATQLIRINCYIMPFNAICNCSYFTMRSGGKTGITFMFDCGFMWVITIPMAYALAHFTGIGILPLFLCVQLMEVFKAFAGIYLVRKGIWINNIVSSADMLAE